MNKQTEDAIILTLPKPESTLFSRADNMLAMVTDMDINSVEKYKEAATLLKGIKGYASQLEASRKEAVKPVNDAIKEFNALYKPSLAACSNAERDIKAVMVAYDDEQERLRREEEDRMREIQEEEQAKIRAEAAKREALERERARRAREKAYAKAAKLAEAGKAEAAEAARIAAEQAEAERNSRAAEEAEAKRQLVESMPAAVLSSAPKTKVSGISTRKVWKFEIIDKEQIPRLYLSVDEVKIGKQVRATEGDTNIPGVNVYQESQIAAGSR